MPFLTNRSYIDFDVHLVGRNTYDTTTTPTNQVKIKASDGAAQDGFGQSVAVGSGRIVVGAPTKNTIATEFSGAAYIYDLNGNQLAKIDAGFDRNSYDYFGNWVAVGCGRIVVSAPFDDDLGSGSGSAYIFDLNGTQIAKIKASDGATDDYFGNRGVAVGCGRIVVGSHRDDDLALDSGSAYIFDLNGNQLAKFKASDGQISDVFGEHVAIGSGRIVVGASLDDDLGSNSGSAYIFNLNGTQIAKIKASDGAEWDAFGTSVAIGSGRIVVGATGDDDLGSSSGSAYIFDLNGTQIAKIKASDGATEDYFGFSVAVGSGRIVVGAYGDDDLGSFTGSAYIFDLNGIQLAKIKSSDGAVNDTFGISVAVGSGRIVVGATGDDDNGNNSGSAYIYTTPNQTHFLDFLDNK